jgi:hypothetical protein
MKIFLIPIILLATSIFTNAQEVMVNNGSLQIHSGSSISGFGSFTNTSSGALVNNGSLHIKGSVTNNEASMTAGTGTLHLDGTSAQAVSGSAPFKTYNFVSDNSAGIVISNNLHVSGAHTFTAGIISTLATPNYLVYEAGSSYSGNGDARHVSGWVKKIGSTDFIFPVGNGSVQRTVELINLSAASEFNVRYYTGAAPNVTSTQVPLRGVDPHEYWAINQTSGGTAQVHLNWDASKIYFPNWIMEDIVVAGYNGSTWIDRGGTATGDVSSTGDITSSSVSAFNLFTFGSQSWVLPLNLVDFTAKRVNGYTQIDWKTSSEYNTSHFVVERSNDGITFYYIGQATARNRSIEENYQHKDHAAINRIAYYRLRCVDKDGREIISRVVTVTETADASLILLNNPVRNTVRLLANAKLSGMFLYQVTMANGQLVQQGTLPIQYGGVYEIPMNAKLQPGAYILKVSNGEQSFDYKLLVL